MDKFLVIDDLRTFKPSVLSTWVSGDGSLPDVTYAKTSRQGLRALRAANSGEYAVVHLDHDLGYDYKTGDEDTIMPCIDYITENADRFRETAFFVHTSNPYAGDTMCRQLETEGLFWVRVNASEFFDIDWS